MVHKFLNQCNIPWVHLIWESYYQNSLPPGENAQCSFWWKDCLKLLDTYKLHSSCTPGSVEAFEQYQEMLGLLQNFPTLDQNDTWRFPSGVTSYAVSNTYIILMGEFHTIPAISWLWKANCS
ncbi:hypothetical protein VPH35_013032 [Triticum aestivum]